LDLPSLGRYHRRVYTSGNSTRVARVVLGLTLFLILWLAFVVVSRPLCCVLVFCLGVVSCCFFLVLCLGIVLGCVFLVRVGPEPFIVNEKCKSSCIIQIRFNDPALLL
jgi:hypothetical protein